MSVVLNRLKYRNFWVTRLGALKACMEFLGKKDSDAWLFGATGHAFVLNVAPDGCSSGPTAWNCDMITNLAHNLGVSVNAVNGWTTEHDFALKQKIAWENTKRALDKGLPCYGWELGIPEFYTICGYNEHGYLYKGIGTPTLQFTADMSVWEEILRGEAGPQLREAFASQGIPLAGQVTFGPGGYGDIVIRCEGAEGEYCAFPMNGQVQIHDDYSRHSEGHKPWEELGNASVGWLHAGWLELGAASDDFTTVLEALEFAVEFAANPPKWVMPGYKSGLPGYDNWIHAVSHAPENDDPQGLAYNGEVWAECRRFAGAFLEEAADRIGGPAGALLREAAVPYQEVAASLARYRSLLPFFGRKPGMPEELRRELLQALGNARKAEEAGLAALKTAYGTMEAKLSAR
ncbi:hypothetical protein [Paenibacillus sp. YN15]|uniref:hypothetical protein n=1 Tax=Paenibacillus sp. YN15 TaxID=1742774 RepID=UPI000DCD36E7|nr:hypothetical protein [Paenibacillus sp. YN15]RAU93837.1 hypothetical protein DQG13_24820 [Paenibacillus sp. YN15]